MIVLLYTRDGCELCDHAMEMFEQLQREEQTIAGHYQIKKVDIALDTELTERYGWSIPVLERPDNQRQLYWPFPPSRLREFLLD